MIIKMPMVAKFQLGSLKLYVDDPRATDPCVRIYRGYNRDGSLDIDFNNVTLHDLFHHQALGLGYDPLSEYMTVRVLDRIYPWYNLGHAHSRFETELNNAKDELREKKIKFPSAIMIKELSVRAKAVLGKLKPLTFKPILVNLFDNYFTKNGYPENELTYYILTVDTEAYTAKFRKSSRKAEGEVQTAAYFSELFQKKISGQITADELKSLNKLTYGAI